MVVAEGPSPGHPVEAAGRFERQTLKKSGSGKAATMAALREISSATQQRTGTRRMPKRSCGRQQISGNW